MSTPSKSMVKDSKLLSLILRHAPEKAGLVLGEGGWVDVEALLQGLSKMNHPMSRERLGVIVYENEKKRFTFSEDETKIRAAQGHSVKIKHDLKPLAPPEALYHGTAVRFIEAIKSQGLRPMSRQHVHLSADTQTAKKVGQRHGKPIILQINTQKMASAGLLFYQADNGVWLTDVVPSEFILWERVT